MGSLRQRVIHLAHDNPELRKHVLRAAPQKDIGPHGRERQPTGPKKQDGLRNRGSVQPQSSGGSSRLKERVF